MLIFLNKKSEISKLEIESVFRAPFAKACNLSIKIFASVIIASELPRADCDIRPEWTKMQIQHIRVF